MRFSLAIATLAAALSLTACSTSRDTMDDAATRDKGAAATRTASFSSYSADIAAIPGSRGAMGGSFTGDLSMSDPQSDTGHYVDFYFVEVNPGDRVAMDLRSTAFDTYLLAMKQDGTGWENDDWQGDLSHSRIEITADQAGGYLIGVTSFDPGSTGTYQLQIDAPGRAGIVPPEALQGSGK